MTESQAMEDEFDTVAAWTANAVQKLGDRHALPAACQGSGSPAALEWLGKAMQISRRSLLDVGAGLGGPAELAARRFDAVPTLAEPMVGACRAAQSLFSRRVVAADGASLPFRDHFFERVWSLGVLCTLEDKAPTLAEMKRVVTPGGLVGLLVFVRTVTVLPVQPDGNAFPSDTEMSALLDEAGFVVDDEASVDDFPAAPPAWQDSVTQVEAAVRHDHGHDDRWSRAQEQQDVIGGLIGDGLVAGRVVVCRVGSHPG